MEHRQPQCFLFGFSGKSLSLSEFRMLLPNQTQVHQNESRRHNSLASRETTQCLSPSKRRPPSAPKHHRGVFFEAIPFCGFKPEGIPPVCGGSPLGQTHMGHLIRFCPPPPPLAATKQNRSKRAALQAAESPAAAWLLPEAPRWRRPAWAPRINDCAVAVVVGELRAGHKNCGSPARVLRVSEGVSPCLFRVPRGGKGWHGALWKLRRTKLVPWALKRWRENSKPAVSSYHLTRTKYRKPLKFVFHFPKWNWLRGACRKPQMEKSDWNPSSSNTHRCCIVQDWSSERMTSRVLGSRPFSRDGGHYVQVTGMFQHASHGCGVIPNSTILRHWKRNAPKSLFVCVCVRVDVCVCLFLLCTVNQEWVGKECDIPSGAKCLHVKGFPW